MATHVDELRKHPCPCGDSGWYACMITVDGVDYMLCWCGSRSKVNFDDDKERTEFIAKYKKTREVQVPSRRAQRRDKVVVVGEGIIATTTGRMEEARPSAQLPPKTPGKHRWIALAAYVMSDKMASEAGDEAVAKFLDHESLFSFHVGCYDCEVVLTATGVSWDSHCSGEGRD